MSCSSTRRAGSPQPPSPDVAAPRTPVPAAPTTLASRESSGRHLDPRRWFWPGMWAPVARRLTRPGRPRRRHRAAGPLAFRRPGQPMRATGVPIAAGPMLAVADLPTVIGNATSWLVGILAVLATFFLTLGGARYLAAGGDPAEVEKAKTALRSAGIGYGLALLAPVILTVLQQILGVGK